MDGARIFNAAIALKVDVKEITRHVDNLMFCLSKGLCCPVGSVVVGSHEFIEKARKVRKVLGGGMRQAGIIAAAGIVAIEKMVNRLQDDHKNAKRLAEATAKIKGIQVDLRRVQTNMVLLNTSGLKVDDTIVLLKLKEKGVLVSRMGEHTLRMVTHLGIEREHVEEAINAVVLTADEINKRVFP